MKNKLGELPDDARGSLHLPSGIPKNLSPYFGDPPHANIPPGLEWIRDLGQEIQADLLEKFGAMMLKARPPHHIEPPFHHTDIDRMNFVQVNAGVQNAVVLNLTVPQGEMARLSFYGQDITAVVAPLPGTEWADVLWTFRVNGTALDDFNAFAGQKGVIGLSPAVTTIVLEDSDLFEIVASNNNPAINYNVWALIRGWQWSTLSTDLPKEDILSRKF